MFKVFLSSAFRKFSPLRIWDTGFIPKRQRMKDILSSQKSWLKSSRYVRLFWWSPRDSGSESTSRLKSWGRGFQRSKPWYGGRARRCHREPVSGSPLQCPQCPLGFRVFRVFRVQHHEPKVTREAEQARKSCRLWIHAGLLLWLREAAWVRDKQWKSRMGCLEKFALGRSRWKSYFPEGRSRKRKSDYPREAFQLLVRVQASKTEENVSRRSCLNIFRVFRRLRTSDFGFWSKKSGNMWKSLGGRRASWKKCSFNLDFATKQTKKFGTLFGIFCRKGGGFDQIQKFLGHFFAKIWGEWRCPKV